MSHAANDPQWITRGARPTTIYHDAHRTHASDITATEEMSHAAQLTAARHAGFAPPAPPSSRKGRTQHVMTGAGFCLLTTLMLMLALHVIPMGGSADMRLNTVFNGHGVSLHRFKAAIDGRWYQYVVPFAFSRDGERLITVYYPNAQDKRGEFIVWRLKDGAIEHQWKPENPNHDIQACHFGDDPNLAFCLSRSNPGESTYVMRWNFATGAMDDIQTISTPLDHPNKLCSLSAERIALIHSTDSAAIHFVERAVQETAQSKTILK